MTQEDAVRGSVQLKSSSPVQNHCCYDLVCLRSHVQNLRARATPSLCPRPLLHAGERSAPSARAPHTDKTPSTPRRRREFTRRSFCTRRRGGTLRPKSKTAGSPYSFCLVIGVSIELVLDAEFGQIEVFGNIWHLCLTYNLVCHWLLEPNSKLLYFE